MSFLDVVLAPRNCFQTSVRRTSFPSSFLPSFLTRNFASFSSRQLSGPLSTLILISRIPASVDAGGSILPRDRRYAYRTPRADARALRDGRGARRSALERIHWLLRWESTTRYVYTQIAETRGNLCEYAAVTQKARNGSVFPGPGLFVLYVRSAPCCVSWPADISAVRNI